MKSKVVGRHRREFIILYIGAYWCASFDSHRGRVVVWIGKTTPSGSSSMSLSAPSHSDLDPHAISIQNGKDEGLLKIWVLDPRLGNPWSVALTCL